jgi:V/A-type H+-transporting ATPase subunit D
MLRRLAEWKTARARYDALHEQAAAALVRAVGRHGLDGLGIYPVVPLEDAALPLESTRFLGVTLLDGRFDTGGEEAVPPPAVNPSPEAERCREAFAALLPLGFELAVMRASLERLMREYVRTERRARALENVVLPEIEDSLRFMDEQLEAMDQEEAIRVRNAAR